MKTFTRLCQINFYDIDLVGHVTNGTYIRWLDDMREQMLRDIGIPLTEIMYRGCMPVLQRSEISFKKGLYYGDDVILKAWGEAISHVRFKFHFTFLRKINCAADHDDLIAQAEQEGFFVKRESYKPVRIFPEILQALSDSGN